ncbi:MAG: hypothetical protein GXX85_14210 [Ignavibacteria bacterium]|jgi:hypothetical protein|nr:hypothetical protein [Ignavibacteria bacterium]
MNNQIIIPKNIRVLLDIAVENIARVMHIEHWDEVAEYMIEAMKLKAEQKYQLPIAGMKYLADVKEHIENCESNSIYTVKKQKEIYA